MPEMTLAPGGVQQIDDGSCASYSVTLVRGGPITVNPGGTVLHAGGTATGSGVGSAITVAAASTAFVSISVTPAAENATSLSLVGTPDSPISDADTARPAGAVAVYWICASGITPTNAETGDLIFNADA